MIKKKGFFGFHSFRINGNSGIIDVLSSKDE